MAADSATLYGALEAFSESYPGMVTLIRGVCYAAAFGIMLYHIMQISKIADGRGSSGPVVKSFAVGLVVATVLLNIPTVLTSLSNTFSMTGNNPYDYGTNLQEGAGPMLKPIINFINFIGLIAFVRGWFVLREWGDMGPSGQKATFNRGAMLVFVGMVGLNITTAVLIVSKTFNMPILASWIAA